MMLLIKAGYLQDCKVPEVHFIPCKYQPNLEKQYTLIYIGAMQATLLGQGKPERTSKIF